MPNNDPLNNVTREEFKAHSTVLFKKLDGVRLVLDRILQLKQDSHRAAVENQLEAQHQVQITEAVPAARRRQRLVPGANTVGRAALAGGIAAAIPDLLKSIGDAVMHGLGLDRREANTTTPNIQHTTPPSLPATPSASTSTLQRLPQRTTAPQTPTLSSTSIPVRQASVSASAAPGPMPVRSGPSEAPASNSQRVPTISGMNDIKDMIKRHEGIRKRPYRDSLGKWTVGVGHLISNTPGGPLPPEWDRELSMQEINDLFEQDFARHVDIAKDTPGYNRANRGGKGAMIDLAFNMGRWWPNWHETTQALEAGDFALAAEKMQQSRWYTQVGERGREVVNLLRNAAEGGAQQLIPTPNVHSGSTLQTQSHAQQAQGSRPAVHGGVIDQSSTTVSNSSRETVSQPVTNLSARNNNPTLANHDAHLTAASAPPHWQ